MERELIYKGSKHKLYKGDIINKWTLLGFVSNKKFPSNGNRAYLQVKCICGSVQEVLVSTITNAQSKGCRFCTLKIYKDDDITGEYVSHLKHGADVRNLCFEITKEDIYNQYLKQNRKCAISGQDVYFRIRRSGEVSTASVDRINSLKGYTVDNIQILHKTINRMKWDLNQNHFIELCKLISKNNE